MNIIKKCLLEATTVVISLPSGGSVTEVKGAQGTRGHLNLGLASSFNSMFE